MKNTRLISLLFAACSLSVLVVRGEPVQPAPVMGYGPDPVLPEPRHKLIPTVKIAPAVGWKAGATPIAAAGLKVNALAVGLDHPRWLYVLPNGDVLVAETNAPPKPDDGKGIKAWATRLVIGRAGANTPSPNRITLLRDADGDGT